KACVSYQHEMMADDLFYVDSAFLKLGNKSVTAIHEIRRNDGLLLASQEVGTVQFHLKKREAVPVHPDVRAQIQAQLDAL
ncbi:MAG: thioesterase family protein, partial [Pseudomonadota bacterium]